MARFIARRILAMIAVLFAISVITFVIFNVIPAGDPAERMAGHSSNPATVHTGQRRRREAEEQDGRVDGDVAGGREVGGAEADEAGHHPHRQQHARAD